MTANSTGRYTMDVRNTVRAHRAPPAVRPLAPWTSTATPSAAAVIRYGSPATPSGHSDRLTATWTAREATMWRRGGAAPCAGGAGLGAPRQSRTATAAG